MPQARQTAPVPLRPERRDPGAAREAEQAHESRLRRIEEPPAMAVMLAPVIGLLLWVGLFKLVF